MKKNKRIASLSLDLDNQWSYMKTHGDSGWETFPSYLDLVVPRILDFLRERNLHITFMVVGQDAAREKNYEAFQAIAAAGHEIGNHSYNHAPWLHLCTEAEVEAEICSAQEAIEQVTGLRPRGFRGPGYGYSPTTLQVLVKRGYQYDASTLPTLMGPLARAYYFMSAKLSKQERLQRSVLFGTLSDGLRPIRPYRLQTDAGQLIEIPITTMPIFRTPIHSSYLLYAGLVSPRLAILYFRTAMLLCKLTSISPSFLLHPLEFLDATDVPELAFFPAMNMPYCQKRHILGQVADYLAREFTVLSLSEHARRIQIASDCRLVESRVQAP